MPSTIPAAMVSAMSGPRSVKMHSFFSFSGMLLDRTDAELALTQLSTKCLSENKLNPVNHL
jgi:hypothetical protein